MQTLKIAVMLTLASSVGACQATPQSPPTQVVYRFDDHRYLELTGFNCQGGLRYIDTQRNIHYQIYDVSDGYRIFTKKFVHPSERYIAITSYEGGGFAISKDYGQTWGGASFAPGGGAVRYKDDRPQREDIESFTVVNDQGFMLTKAGDIYMSSKPFDDPRLSPGGSGIAYTFLDHRGNLKQDRLMPGNSGLDWGREYLSWNSVNSPKPWVIDAFKPNWQNIPNKVPEVKNYTGWDHMRCDPNLGLASK
ncbi:T6SS immunity protein Tli3 family protein [Rahnella sp. EDr1-12]|uniref:T6SS immunity protein Tli3 family protein n=1 Tax=unclassified Rahnella TaxID=2635087 RepID=UPI003BAD9273